MIVVDASVLAESLVSDGARAERCREELGRDSTWIAPEHVVVETLSVIRGVMLGGKVSATRAEEAVAALQEIAIEHVATEPLVPTIWLLRHNMTAYDAAYAAVAMAEDITLVTIDGGLAEAARRYCPVLLVTA